MLSMTCSKISLLLLCTLSKNSKAESRLGNSQHFALIILVINQCHLLVKFKSIPFIKLTQYETKGQHTLKSCTVYFPCTNHMKRCNTSCNIHYIQIAFLQNLQKCSSVWDHLEIIHFYL